MTTADIPAAEKAALRAGPLVVASHNDGKVREISDLLRPYGLDVVSAKGLNLPEPEETGSSFRENAILKAVAAAEAAGRVALADDSGLSVTALGGAPGIYSARWAEGPDGSRDFTSAMERVHRELGASADRGAAFVCVLALAWPSGQVNCFEGRVTGEITWPPRGSHGFGYDPVFIPAGHDMTFGEMDPQDKHAISHRAAAFRKLVQACFETGAK